MKKSVNDSVSASSRGSRKGLLPCGRPAPHADEACPAEAYYQNKLKHYSTREGLNRSEARDRVLSVVANQAKHFTAQSLVKEVQAVHPEIGAATVYRNLPVFVAAEILRESLADENGQIVYELESEAHHDHIVCLDCNAILEFRDEEIEAQQEKIMKRLRFRPARHRHVIYARCEYLASRKK